MINKSNKYPLNGCELGSRKNLNDYLSATHEIKRLTAEDEHRLVKLKESGDLDAAQELIITHLPYVVHVAKQFSGYKLPLADLIQEGNIGLMKAIKRFESKHKVRVATYAIHWISSEIKEYVIKNTRIFKIATTKPQRKLFFNLRSNKTHSGTFTQQEVDDLAKKLNVKPSEVREMEYRLRFGDLPFDSHPTSNTVTEWNDGTPLVPIQYIKNPTISPEEQFEQDDTEGHKHAMLYSAMSLLNERELDIIKRRWLDEDKSTLNELAAEYNISAERIRQIEGGAMKKIRNRLTN